jgi:alpha 1,3-mannosyltransferase
MYPNPFSPPVLRTYGKPSTAAKTTHVLGILTVAFVALLWMYNLPGGSSSRRPSYSSGVRKPSRPYSSPPSYSGGSGVAFKPVTVASPKDDSSPLASAFEDVEITLSDEDYYEPIPPSAPVDMTSIADTLQYFVDFPLKPPYISIVGEQGRRTRIARDWLAQAEQGDTSFEDTRQLEQAVEVAVTVLYPFLSNSPRFPYSETPLADLRNTFVRGSAGIVIPVSDWTMRFAAHQIAQLREVMQTTLPIQVAYAGDVGLSPENREWLRSHLMRLMDSLRPDDAPLTAHEEIEFLDLTDVFDDSIAQLVEEASFEDEAMAGRAIKAFAALGSSFERVILLDPGSVFVQPPEELLIQRAFRRTGTLLFHDRLAGRGQFAGRRSWMKQQVKRPSKSVTRNRAWRDEYSDEQDGNVVVVHKGRTDVLMGLLHVAWQNTGDVRTELGYEMSYDDKESWWMGLEMSGAEFEKHYGSVMGWEVAADGVCSFGVAHLDDSDKVIWYSGGLAKNMGRPGEGDEYEVPHAWMTDAEWDLGDESVQMSCMIGGVKNQLTEDEETILRDSIARAKVIDDYFIMDADF